MKPRGRSSAFGHSLRRPVACTFEGTSPVRYDLALHHGSFDIGTQNIHYPAFLALHLNCGSGSRNDLVPSAIAPARRALALFEASPAGLSAKRAPGFKCGLRSTTRTTIPGALLRFRVLHCVMSPSLPASLGLPSFDSTLGAVFLGLVVGIMCVHFFHHQSRSLK